MSLVGEALRAGFQPCSYSLLILAVVVLGLRGERSRLPALAVYYLSVTLLAWVPFLGVDPLLDGRIAGTAGLAVGLGLSSRRGGERLSGVIRMAGVALVGAFAGATWLPCVGPELGTILTGAVRDPWPGLAGLALYLMVVLLLPGILAAIADYYPPIREALARRRVVVAFRAVGAILVLSVAADLFPLLLSHLARISSL